MDSSFSPPNRLRRFLGAVLSDWPELPKICSRKVGLRFFACESASAVPCSNTAAMAARILVVTNFFMEQPSCAADDVAL